MNANNEIKYIPMYKSYIEAVSKLSAEDRLTIYEAIFEYGFTGVEPVFTNPYLEMGWNLVKPNLVNNMASLARNIKNGAQGGRPKKSETQKVEATITPTVAPELKSAPVVTSKVVSEQPAPEERVYDELDYEMGYATRPELKSTPQNKLDIKPILSLLIDDDIYTENQFNTIIELLEAKDYDKFTIEGLYAGIDQLTLDNKMIELTYNFKVYDDTSKELCKRVNNLELITN
jgi:hypothetical protein